MARARNIKPGFYKNEDLAECSIWARFLFPGLWMMADRDGRLEDRPKRIKAEILPFDTQDAEPLLRELASHGFIIRYQNDGASYIQITKFADHQAPHYSEKPSVIKPPNLPEFTTLKEPPKPAEPISLRGGRNPLNPESLFTESLSPLTPDGDDLFETFWKAYPKKVGKDAAKKSFDKRRPGKKLLLEMLRALETQGQSEQWRRDGGQFIPNPATWLNQGRWQDGEDDLGTPDETIV